MSNEAETMKKSKRTLTPKLRFPEFRDEPGWEAEPLGSVSHFVKKKIPLHQLNLDTYVSTENISPDYGGIEQASKLPPNGSATEYKPDDILIANIRPYLKKVWRSNRSGGASNDVIVIRSKAVLRKDYLPMVIANDAFINYVMKTAKGVKMPRGDIASMKEYIIYYPDPAEQQKVAECLSSLDGLIAAEGRTLEALKAHKKGLMQQLFPQPGQTQPRLRFPEFRDKEEWEECKLGKLVDISSGKSPSQYVLSSDGIYPFVKVEDLNNCTKYQVNSREYCDDAGGVVPERSILFPKRGAAIELNKIRITAVEILIDTNLMAITPRDLATSEFLFYYLGHVGLSQIADTSSIPQINNKHIIPFNISAPSRPEQQRIADCLSALDDQIAAQAVKIETLKTHKSGLMQQLFPAPEEQ